MDANAPAPVWAVRWLPLRDGEGWQAGLLWLTFAFLVAVSAWYLLPGQDITAVDVALACALTVVVPYGLFRVVPTPKWRDDFVARETPAELALLGALAVTVSHIWDGFAAPTVLLLWLVPVTGTLFASVRQMGYLPDRRRPWTSADWLALLAQGWLVVAAAWLVVHRAGWQPFGLDAAIVELTAVHFHYAGFATAVIARETWLATRSVAPRAALFTVAATAAGPPVIAAGFVLWTPLLPTGAVILTLGLWTVAWLTVRRVVPTARHPAKGLLVASSVAILGPMVLAVQWALSNVADIPALAIPDMAVWHGMANAFGFSLLGLLGWHLHLGDKGDS